MESADFPHSFEAEMGLLGAIMLNNRAYDRMADTLRAAHFFDRRNGVIFEAVQEIIGEGKVADPITLKRFFPDQDKGPFSVNPAYLANLAGQATTPINAGEYAYLVTDLYHKRMLILAAETLIENAAQIVSDDYAPAIQEAHERTLFELAELGTGEDGPRLISEYAEKAMAAVEKARAGDGVAGLSTGLIDLDSLLGGLHPTDLIVCAGRPSMGKAQPLDAKVRCVVGWKQIGDLKIGDSLASVDGQPSSVAGLFPQGRKRIYRLTFSDGRTTRCCGEHLWRIHYRSWDEARLLTTHQLRSMLARQRYQKRLWIDYCSGDFGHNDKLPIDPWLLGALLGDGSFRGSRILFSTADSSIASKVAKSIGHSLQLQKAGGYDYRIVQTADHRRPGGSPGVWPNPLKQSLETIGLWGKRSEEKFIPDHYMMANKSTRLALLCGLLDTDGWIEKWGTVRFCTTSKRLADDTTSLARSLGAWCSMKIKAHPAYTYRGKKKRGRTAYILTIRHNQPKRLFSLSRKRARIRVMKRRRMATLLSIETAGFAETQCIAVTHPKQTYLTDDYILTHNTALATTIGFNVAATGTPVLGFSLEMSGDQLALREIGGRAGVSSHKLRLGSVDMFHIDSARKAATEISKLPFWIDDRATLSIEAVRSTARRMKRKAGIGLVIVDYLQLLTGKGENRVQEISMISRGLKAVAKELQVPVLAISQLSRMVEQRTPPRPQLSDLRESGSIEQDADSVLLIYREAYYHERKRPEQKENENEYDFNGRKAKWEDAHEIIERKAEVIIAKQRHGPCGTVDLHFSAKATRFENSAEGSE